MYIRYLLHESNLRNRHRNIRAKTLPAPVLDHLLAAVNLNQMDEETFNNLKVGDRVLCNYGSEATVLRIGAEDVRTKRKMVVLKCDKKKWGCPFFYRHELKRMA
jgi:hypothetical protein